MVLLATCVAAKTGDSLYLVSSNRAGEGDIPGGTGSGKKAPRQKIEILRREVPVDEAGRPALCWTVTRRLYDGDFRRGPSEVHPDACCNSKLDALRAAQRWFGGRTRVLTEQECGLGAETAGHGVVPSSEEYVDLLWARSAAELEQIGVDAGAGGTVVLSYRGHKKYKDVRWRDEAIDCEVLEEVRVHVLQ